MLASRTSQSLTFCLLLCVTFAQKQCVSLFDRNPELFDVCLKKECILFRTEVPFVFVDKRMNEQIHQRPFACSAHQKQFSDTRGPFFDIVNALPSLRDAQCVWGGTECSFDDMISFVNRTARDNAKGYKFIAGGLLFSLEYRLSPYTVPSVPLLEDQLVIIGPRNDDRVSWANAWDALWRPFTTKAWVMLFLTTTSVLFLRVWISAHFTVPFKWHEFRDNFLGDYSHTSIGASRARVVAARSSHNNLDIQRHKDPSELRRLNSYISNGVKILFVIIILYYEIAVVDFIFQDRQDRINTLSPKEFAITKESTMSRVFNNEFLNRTRRRGSRGCEGNEACWHEVDSIQVVYDTITDRNSTKSKVYQYSYVYESFNRYWFQQNTTLCGELQVLEFEKLNRKFAGVWYYSPKIPLERRVKIDRSILQLRERDGVREILHRESGAELPPKCQTSTSISVLLLGVPIFMFSGPILTFVFFYMVVHTIRSRREISDREQGSDEEGGNARNASSDCYTGDSVSYDTSMIDSRKCDCFSQNTGSSVLKSSSRITGHLQ